MKWEPWNVHYFDLRFVFKTVVFVSEQVIELGGLILLLLHLSLSLLLKNGDAHLPELLSGPKWGIV